MLRTIKPAYTKHGFSLTFTTEDSVLPGHYRTVCTCRHSQGHSTLHRVDLPVDGQGAKGGASAMNPVQGGGSTLSYARRYLTYLIFNLVIADEDNDAQGGITKAQVNELEEIALEAAVVLKTSQKWVLDEIFKWLKKDRLMSFTEHDYGKAYDFLLTKIPGTKRKRRDHSREPGEEG